MLPIGDENEPGHGPALVTLAFIAINIFVFLVLQGAGSDGAFTYSFSAVPFEITHGVDLVGPEVVPVGNQEVLIPQGPGPEPIYLTLLTSMFMHAGWLHLGGNMLFLFIFGDNVEHFVGAAVYAIFYLAAGIVASLAQVFVAPESVIPSLGASGAISGVLGAYIVLFPSNRVTVIVFRFPAQVPALVAIGMWAVFQFISGLGAFAVSEQTTGGVAYMAHIGGFVAGLVAGLLFRATLGSPARRVRRSAWG
ncbi:MAG: rhomboid family intramembrane serine protease [Candidatus Limnocylindria bacterium]